MRISDWSSDVCSSDLRPGRISKRPHGHPALPDLPAIPEPAAAPPVRFALPRLQRSHPSGPPQVRRKPTLDSREPSSVRSVPACDYIARASSPDGQIQGYVFGSRSEEHTSELQSLMRISYAVFCLKKKI